MKALVIIVLSAVLFILLTILISRGMPVMP